MSKPQRIVVGIEGPVDPRPRPAFHPTPFVHFENDDQLRLTPLGFVSATTRDALALASLSTTFLTQPRAAAVDRYGNTGLCGVWAVRGQTRFSCLVVFSARRQETTSLFAGFAGVVVPLCGFCVIAASPCQLGSRGSARCRDG